MKTILVSALLATASAFAPSSQIGRGVTSLNAEMSKSIPFLTRPEKLDGSMPGDMGFDPMGLSEIQVDLKYARWSELKHGRIAMLAIVGMVVQSAGIHLPGDAYTNADPFGAPSTVGWAVNLQIFLFMSGVEIATFNKTYSDDAEPGDLGWNTPDLISKLSPADLAKRKESEIVHCRLAMIAITGAAVQYLLYGKLGL